MGFGTYLTMPTVIDGLGVISTPSSYISLRNSKVASMVATAIHTLASPRCFPGQSLSSVNKDLDRRYIMFG